MLFFFADLEASEKPPAPAYLQKQVTNCEQLTKSAEACNKCQSCIWFNDGASLNIHELDAASNNSVDDIRALVEQVRFAPQAGRYKVYIIDEVGVSLRHSMHCSKTLKNHLLTRFLYFATTEKHKILPTILSRCRIFDFKRITDGPL